MNDPQLFWEKHLKAIALEGVTIRAYAEREGLAVKDLYHWRRKFKSRTLSQRSKHQPETSPGGSPGAT